MSALEERAPQRPGGDARRALSDPAAAALVFCASGAVLVLEILAVRLLAPYIGLTLEAYTSIIGVVLAGIAFGSWYGGQLADRLSPRRLLGPLLILGGGLAMLTVPLARGLGDLTMSGPTELGVLPAFAAFLPPAAVLSAVMPTVAKLQLGDLRRSGTVVGRLSAWATAGALLGTFATGFVLVPLLPTRTTVLAVGGLLVLAGVGVALRLGGGSPGLLSAAVGGAVIAAAGGFAVGSPCERESAYYCARVQADPARPSGRVLVLDDLRHSYVDLADPGYLGFRYTQWIGAAIDASAPRWEPLDALFVGGGGFTLPRWLQEVRPGSRALVLEVDGQVVDIARDRLGLRISDTLRVRVGDGRTLLRREPARSADVIVGDAFGSLSIPWHLTTREFLRDVRRVLRPGGIYALNVIDAAPLALARAEAATLLEGFPHVAVIGLRGAGPGGLGDGNLVMVAGARPASLGALARDRGLRVLDRPGTERFAAGALVLSDDRAPADQLLTPPR